LASVDVIAKIFEDMPQNYSMQREKVSGFFAYLPYPIHLSLTGPTNYLRCAPTINAIGGNG